MNKSLINEEVFIQECKEIVQKLETLQKDDKQAMEQEWNSFEELLSKIQKAGIDKQVFVRVIVKAMREKFGKDKD